MNNTQISNLDHALKIRDKMDKMDNEILKQTQHSIFTASVQKDFKTIQAQANTTYRKSTYE